MANSKQLRGYIPPSAPLNWEPVKGDEPPIRAGFSFTINWFHKRAGIDYSERYHTDPVYRYECLKKMKAHIAESFPDAAYYREHDESECATVSGIFGVCLVGMVYGLNPVFYKNNWPGIKPEDHFSVEKIKKLKPFDLENNAVVGHVLEQMEIIEKNWGLIDGYINYQGVVNNAFKIRGTDIFYDMVEDPGLVHFLFEHITDTMINLAHLLQRRQRESNFHIDSLSTSNCVINMISPEYYEEFVLPYDIRLSKAFDVFGMHSCNWVLDPYIEGFKQIENLGYVDFGFKSDLDKIRHEFPDARLHVFYSADNLINKSPEEQEADVKKIYKALGDCDLSVPDIELTVPDEVVSRFVSITENVT